MSRSDYDFGLSKYNFAGGPVEVLTISDQDLGRMSVTNNIEEILKEIAPNLARQLSEYPIIYRDSMGSWDEVLVNTENTFAGFMPLPRHKGFRMLMRSAVERWSLRRGAKA